MGSGFVLFDHVLSPDLPDLVGPDGVGQSAYLVNNKKARPQKDALS